MLRRLPSSGRTCAVLYGNARTYTVWAEAGGLQAVDTPVGQRMAQRYDIRYGTDRGPQVVTGQLYLSQAATRLPYRVELVGRRHTRASLSRYASGR